MVEVGNAWVVNREDYGAVDQAVLWLRNNVAPVLKWTCALMERATLYGPAVTSAFDASLGKRPNSDFTRQLLILFS